MARKRNEKLKQILLLAFVLLSVILVVLIWADGLREGEEALPGYYRELGNETLNEAPQPNYTSRGGPSSTREPAT